MKYLYLFKVNILHGKFLEERRSSEKKMLIFVTFRNSKFNRDEIVEKRCPFQRSFYIQLPEIAKFVESVEMKSFIGISENCPEGFHACVNVTGNEKKHWAVTNEERRALFCLLCFITRG